jgi:hypothetical protein
LFPLDTELIVTLIALSKVSQDTAIPGAVFPPGPIVSINCPELSATFPINPLSVLY